MLLNHLLFAMNIQALLITSCYVVIIVSTLAHAQSMKDVPVEVNRTLSADLYRLHKDNASLMCTEGNTSTYMVAEGVCINDQQLFNGNVYSP